jgi:hypothetical protein
MVRPISEIYRDVKHHTTRCQAFLSSKERRMRLLDGAARGPRVAPATSAQLQQQMDPKYRWVRVRPRHHVRGRCCEHLLRLRAAHDVDPVVGFVSRAGSDTS